MQMKPCGTSQDAAVHLHAVIPARPPASVKQAIAARLVRPAASAIFMIRHCSVSGTASIVIDNNTFMGIIYDPDTMVLWQYGTRGWRSSCDVGKVCAARIIDIRCRLIMWARISYWLCLVDVGLRSFLICTGLYRFLHYGCASAAIEHAGAAGPVLLLDE